VQAVGSKQHAGGLAARLGPQPGRTAAAPFPEIISQLAAALLQPDTAATVPDLAYHAQGSPWLQALLTANAGDA
jgi:hypothetical protein